MRLDKYLKASRLIKRRTVAKDLTAAGKVTVNGRVAKPSTEIKAGDILEIGYGARKVRVEVLETKETVPAAEAGSLYRVIE
ncbi:MAG: RNA-binding S4 domain-containing protein [Peptococcaceae bacterium]|nr:RNA-binding S4 domain-containing protein [Peptococcaceae bacterium]MDH7526075.1 RNA-binding S4 domain-containing protein [Peptococcaceae bacterium]